MDMVERVARQICCEGGQCEFRNCDALADWGDQAKAAIRAMLEGLEQDLALTELANIEGASDEWLEDEWLNGFRFAVSRLSALKEVVG